jgi:Mn-containing catalase
MSEYPTRYAAAGKHISRGGEDFHQFLDASGNVLYWVDSDGVAWGADYITAAGNSIDNLKVQLDSFVGSGIPSVIDSGTF